MWAQDSEIGRQECEIIRGSQVVKNDVDLRLWNVMLDGFPETVKNEVDLRQWSEISIKSDYEMKGEVGTTLTGIIIFSKFYTGHICHTPARDYSGL